MLMRKQKLKNFKTIIVHERSFLQEVIFNVVWRGVHRNDEQKKGTWIFREKKKLYERLPLHKFLLKFLTMGVDRSDEEKIENKKVIIYFLLKKFVLHKFTRNIVSMWVHRNNGKKNFNALKTFFHERSFLHKTILKIVSMGVQNKHVEKKTCFLQKVIWKVIYT